MPFDKLGHTTARSPASWPGVAPLGGKPVPKFGNVQQAPRSAPQRALDAIRHQLQKMGLLRREPVRTGPPPLPRQAPPVAPFGKMLGPTLQRLAEAHATHDPLEASAAAEALGAAVDDVLRRMRSGTITGWLDAPMKQALASGDTQAFADALTAKVLEALPPGSSAHADDGLAAAVLAAVQASIDARGPLTAPAPAPAAPQPLLGSQHEPLVRLQALAATADEMAPMLDTLHLIADSMSLGDSARVEQHLSTLATQLRPLLERQDKAVKVAFAQSDGQAFIQDLAQAILAQAADGVRDEAALAIEHFMGPYLKSAFGELVSGMLDANPDVQRASFRLPVDANVGVLAVRQVAQALLALQRVPADASDEVKREASLGLRREIGNFLGLVRSGAVAPEVAQAFQGVMLDDDVPSFIDAMSRALLAAAPADQRESVRQLLDQHLAPVVQDDVALHGPLKVASAPTPALQPRTHVDAPLLPKARLGLLQGPAAQTLQAQATMAAVAQAMRSDAPAAVKKQLDTLVAQLRPLLLAQSDTVRLAFTVSGGEDFVSDLAKAILEQTPAADREHVAAQLELFMRPALHRAFDHLVSGVGDQAHDYPGDQNPPKSVTVGDRTYTLVRDDKGLPVKVGSGNFGVLYKYRNLAVEGRTDDFNRPLKDEVVLKMPLVPNEKKGTPMERRLLLDDPVREGRAALQVMGTGGGTARTTQLVGAVRTPERMMLIYRFEEGGELKSKVDALGTGPTDEKVARGKLGLMLDLVGALRRLHESKGLMHLDIALRNVLLDEHGRAVLNDFGLSQFMAEGGALDGASVKPGTEALPLRWTAPEVRQGQPVTQQSEVFSLGVAFIELAWGLGKGLRPWGSEDDSTFKRGGPPWNAAAMIAKLGPMPAHLWPGVDRAQLQQLITRMIDADPAQRPTLAEVAASPVLQGVLPEHRQALMAKLGIGSAVAKAPAAPAVASPVANAPAPAPAPGPAPAPAPAPAPGPAPAPAPGPAPGPATGDGTPMEYHQV